MIFLVLAILCSSSLSIIMKFSSKRKPNLLSMNFFIFVSATLFSILLVIKQVVTDPEWLPVLLSEFGQAAVTPFTFALLMGLINAVLYTVAFYVLQVSVARNGTAMTYTFNKLGIIIPAVLSVLLFHEKPKLSQGSGVLIAFLAISLIYFKKEENSAITLKAALLGTFLLGGFSTFTSKIYQVYGAERYENLFILFTYLFALIISGVFMLVKDRRIKCSDVIFGLMAGIPSQLVTLLVLLALTSIPAFVVFPLNSAGAILVINIINLIFFKEKLTIRQFIAIGLIISAIILMNI
jgi:drug/metabolite transporter (DMT)-like permease